MKTNEYSKAKKIDLGINKVDLKKLIIRNDKYGDYAKSVVVKIIDYASSLVPEITENYNDIDEALRLGFNWSKGPFEILEEIGVKDFLKLSENFNNNKFLQKLHESKSRKIL